ncbi:MAG: arginine decarboxylase, partial [Sphingobacteriales bacterium]
MDKYTDLIHQTFDFPNEEFTVHNSELAFNGIPLMELVKEYGTPLRLTYLPKISSNIQKAKLLFKESMEKLNYKGWYKYAYCTKSSHFSFVLEEGLKNDIHIETSSGYDIPIIRQLYRRGKLSKDTYIICNGYKREQYRQNISDLLNDGFKNCMPILDHLEEIEHYEQHVNVPTKLG